jgi:hypothetical protein
VRRTLPRHRALPSLAEAQRRRASGDRVRVSPNIEERFQMV